MRLDLRDSRRGALVAGALALLIVLPAAASVPAAQSFNNGLIRFGKVEDRSDPATAAEEPSVNEGGTLNAPYYAGLDGSGAIERWLRLTFSERALDFAVGVGECVGTEIDAPTGITRFHDLDDGECFWHRNMALASSNGNNYFPHYNAGSTSSSGPGTRGGLENVAFDYAVTDGVGTITVTGEFDVLPPPAADRPRFAAHQTAYRFRVEHRYEVIAGQRFLRARTTVTNITETTTAPNVNIWVGTRDDYLGDSAQRDTPKKERGNVGGGTFTRITSAAGPSNAIRVYTDEESILFYSTTPGVNTIFQRHGDFYERLIPTSPADSGSMRNPCRQTESGDPAPLDPIACYDRFFDGSYAIFLPAGDLAPGSSRRIDWFYAAGPAAEVASVVEEVSVVADLIAEESAPQPPAPSRRVVNPVDVAAGIAIAQADGLGRTDALLVRRDVAVPLTTSVTTSAHPRGGLVIEDSDQTLRVTITTARGVTTADGIVVAPDGEIVCETCAALTDDSVIEAWIYSDPRLAAAVRIEADPEFECPLLRIPVGAPLDGGGPIGPGPHTLQLRLSTPAGIEVIAVPITIGATGELPLPRRIDAGGGPVPLVPLDTVLVVALLGAAALTTERGRALAAAGAAEHQARLRARARHCLPAFDALQRQLDERRRAMRSGG